MSANNSQGNGPPEHVEDKGNSVHVGKSRCEKCKERANCDDQQDRIEAKLDLILDELGVDH